mgnify:FL=1
MNFKQALGIANPDWRGIGKHLSILTQDALDQSGENAINLTNYLRLCSNRFIEPAYVEEYLSGNTSFGCFFPQFREYLRIEPVNIFPSVDEIQARQGLQALEQYLTDVNNPESLVIFLKYQPGKELREHVACFLSERRAAFLQTLNTKSRALSDESLEALDCEISGENKQRSNYFLGLSAWHEAYTCGTFNTLHSSYDTQMISNLAMRLRFNVDNLLPMRELTAAERYEVHQRWAHHGGVFRPGINLKGPQEVERQMRNRPDPLGQSEFEDIACRINSHLIIVLGLVEQLPNLVAEPPLFVPMLQE